MIKSTRVLCHDCDPKISTRTASPRNANIVTTIEVSEGGEVRVATSDAESEGEANIVTFIPATDWIYIVSILTVFFVLVK